MWPRVRIGNEPGAPAHRLNGSDVHLSAVRRSCHTIAGYTGRVVARSQTTVVSRWFVIPIAARSAARIPAAPSVGSGLLDARPDLLGVVLDQPRRGEGLPDLAVAAPDRASRSSTTRHVVPVVPWSIARITAWLRGRRGLVRERSQLDVGQFGECAHDAPLPHLA